MNAARRNRQSSVRRGIDPRVTRAECGAQIPLPPVLERGLSHDGRVHASNPDLPSHGFKGARAGEPTRRVGHG